MSGNAGSTHTEPAARADDLNRFRARGYVFVDQRQSTEYGLLRAYTRLSFSRDNAADAGVLFEYAYVQLGGLTAGKFMNPYDTTYYSGGWAPLGLGGFGAVDNTSQNGIAYAASLGNGVTASLAVMAGNETKAAQNTAGNLTAAAQGAPDVTATIEAVQSWGSVKVGAALHQIRYVNSAIDTDYGMGVGGGVKFNLPMIAAGDFISFAGQYAQGANLYGGVGAATAFRAGQAAPVTADAIIANGVSKLSTTWGVNAGFLHVWTKTVDTNVYGAYQTYENSGAGTAAAGTGKAKGWIVAQYTKWTPIAGLQFGVETGYRKMGGNLTTVGTDREDFFGRVRVQRDF